MQAFTPISSTIGGLLLGGAATILLMLNGRIAGISGIVGGLVPPRPGELAWRAWFILGLLVGGVALLVFHPTALQVTHRPSLAAIALAGVLVGVGTQIGNGCTSGHGVCGISRLSPRSIASTITFIAAGAVTVVVIRLLSRGAP